MAVPWVSTCFDPSPSGKTTNVSDLEISIYGMSSMNNLMFESSEIVLLFALWLYGTCRWYGVFLGCKFPNLGYGFYVFVGKVPVISIIIHPFFLFATSWLNNHIETYTLKPFLGKFVIFIDWVDPHDWIVLWLSSLWLLVLEPVVNHQWVQVPKCWWAKSPNS